MLRATLKALLLAMPFAFTQATPITAVLQNNMNVPFTVTLQYANGATENKTANRRADYFSPAASTSYAGIPAAVASAYTSISGIQLPLAVTQSSNNGETIFTVTIQMMAIVELTNYGYADKKVKFQQTTISGNKNVVIASQQVAMPGNRTSQPAKTNRVLVPQVFLDQPSIMVDNYSDGQWTALSNSQLSRKKNTSGQPLMENGCAVYAIALY